MLDKLRLFVRNLQFGDIRTKRKILFTTTAIKGTILGDVILAVNHHGLMSIDFDHNENQFIQQTSKLFKARFSKDNSALNDNADEATDQIARYLLGELESLDLQMDLTGIKKFQLSVLKKVQHIHRGQIVTYGELAKMVGKPKGARAIGQALRRNPIPIVIPCHRVISADGTLGGYGGRMGSERKQALLKLEGAILI